ncbi:hypothetical protein [Lentzea sp. NPDC051838]|uniref:hypothetical protein n=1 Tax=Lentzea sp. NPDC051838 TaxID=3154849 RepID=UPI0034329754
MRVPGFLLALLLVFVGTSARQDVDSSASGLNASVSVVHVLSVPSPDACWALCRAGSGPGPSFHRGFAAAVRSPHVEATSSGPRSSRAPPFAAASDFRASLT